MEKYAKIRIIECAAIGGEFITIRPGSVHNVLKWGKDRSVYVMGLRQPVCIFDGEYEVVKEGVSE